MTKKRGVLLAELSVTIILLAFIIFSFYKTSSQINLGYEITDKNVTAIYMGESVKNWVKAKLDENYSIDNLPLDEAKKLIANSEATLHFSKNTENVIKYRIRMKQGTGFRQYSFEVPINE